MAVTAYLIIRLLLLIAVVAELILILIILVLKLALVEVFNVLVLESLAGEPVNSTGNELLLDVLTKLVVEFETLFNIGGGVVLVLWGLGGVKEVEERLCRYCLLNDSCLLGVCKTLVS
mgnify:CR=1 FL=1